MVINEAAAKAFTADEVVGNNITSIDARVQALKQGGGGAPYKPLSRRVTCSVSAAASMGFDR